MASASSQCSAIYPRSNSALRTSKAALQYEAAEAIRGLYLSSAFYLQTGFFGVEPRGFEPLTSAVQKLIGKF